MNFDQENNQDYSIGEENSSFEATVRDAEGKKKSLIAAGWEADRCVPVTMPTSFEPDEISEPDFVEAVTIKLAEQGMDLDRARRASINIRPLLIRFARGMAAETLRKIFTALKGSPAAVALHRALCDTAGESFESMAERCKASKQAVAKAYHRIAQLLKKAGLPVFS